MRLKIRHNMMIASYADLIFVSFLHFLKRVDIALFDRFVSIDPTFSRVYDASKEWLKKDD